MIVKTEVLEGVALNWAVAKCEGITDIVIGDGSFLVKEFEEYTCYSDYQPVSRWDIGGRIIDQEWIGIERETTPDGLWCANKWVDDSNLSASGSSALEAAMRCYVISKLGHEIDIPNGLPLPEVRTRKAAP